MQTRSRKQPKEKKARVSPPGYSSLNMVTLATPLVAPLLDAMETALVNSEAAPEAAPEAEDDIVYYNEDDSIPIPTLLKESKKKCSFLINRTHTELRFIYILHNTSNTCIFCETLSRFFTAHFFIDS